MDKFYTTEDVGEILCIQPRAVTRWIREGRLVAVKLGKEYRISESELERFIKERETTGKKEEG